MVLTLGCCAPVGSCNKPPIEGTLEECFDAGGTLQRARADFEVGFMPTSLRWRRACAAHTRS